MKVTTIALGLSLATATLFANSTGKEIFDTNCKPCHATIVGIDTQVEGEYKPVFLAPYVGEVVAKLKKETGTKEAFRAYIADYINEPDKRKSLYGKRAIKKFGLMPPLKGVLSSEDIDHLVDYLYNEEYKLKDIKKPEPKKVVKVDPRAKLFDKNCKPCHATAIGIDTQVEGEYKLEFPAPYVADVVKKIAKKTGSKEKFVEYIKEYINDPDMRKSLYGKRAIKKFGLMPPLKGVMSDQEVTQLANYLYETYNK